MVAKQDEVRKTLHAQLTSCIEEMESIPFTERANTITVSLDIVSVVHHIERISLKKIIIISLLDT